MSRNDTEELLETSPFDDDLQEALTARPARAGGSKPTLALAGGVLLVAGLLLGIQVQKLLGGSTAGQVPSRAGGPGAYSGQALAGGGLGGAGGGARPGSGAGSGGMTFGTVKLVDGDKIYVQTVDGGVVTVTTSGDTKVRVSRTGKVSDLKPGSFVTVAGAADARGQVAATSVTQGSPPGRRAGS